VSAIASTTIGVQSQRRARTRHRESRITDLPAANSLLEHIFEPLSENQPRVAAMDRMPRKRMGELWSLGSFRTRLNLASCRSKGTRHASECHLSRSSFETIADEINARTRKCRQFCGCESLQLPQRSIPFNEWLATGSMSNSYKPRISTSFNMGWNLVRDQGVGGSNRFRPLPSNKPS